MSAETPNLVPIAGGCKCGAVRYQLAGLPLFTHACHCLDCQGRTGSPYSLTTFVLHKDLSISEGNMAAKKVSPRSTEHSCAKCGTIINVTSTAFPVSDIMRPETFDSPNVAAAGAHIWVKRRQPGIVLPADIPQFDEQYNPEKVWPQESLNRLSRAED